MNVPGGKASFVLLASPLETTKSSLHCEKLAAKKEALKKKKKKVLPQCNNEYTEAILISAGKSFRGSSTFQGTLTPEIQLKTVTSNLEWLLWNS